MQTEILAAQGSRQVSNSLEFLLNEVLCNLYPSQEDHRKRLTVIAKLNNVIQGIAGLQGASVVPFGSFESDLYSKWGDLDISIEVPTLQYSSTDLGKKRKQKILRQLERAIIRGGIAQSVQLILWARVPLLIFEDPYSNISCDVSINNGSALLKSKCLRLLTRIDSRFKELVFLIKYWAKVHNINDPKTGTLNSFSLALLVIFHLQTRCPAILPPLKDIYDGDIGSELKGAANKRTTEEAIFEQWKTKAEQFIHENFGKGNHSSISDLFVSFFEQYMGASGFWSNTLSVCTFTGQWENGRNDKFRNPLIVEDPIDHAENCARSVVESKIQIMSDAFKEAYEILQNPANLNDVGYWRQSLFGSSRASNIFGEPSHPVLPHIVQRNQIQHNHSPNFSGAYRIEEPAVAINRYSNLPHRSTGDFAPSPSSVNHFRPSHYRHENNFSSWAKRHTPTFVAPYTSRFQGRPRNMYDQRAQNSHVPPVAAVGTQDGHEIHVGQHLQQADISLNSPNAPQRSNFQNRQQTPRVWRQK